MKQSHKVLFNTSALYIKIVLSAIVTIFSTSIALRALGVEAFGLYNLIAGVIILLSFLNGSLMISSQRFMSIALGEKDDEKLANIFNVSLLVHLVLGSILTIGFLSLLPFIFDGMLNIPENMLEEAKTVFYIMVASAFFTVVTIPYSASINAREEMWFFSLSDILVSVLKLSAAATLLYIDNNLLLVYSSLMLFAILVGILSKYIWCSYRYEECRISYSKMLNKTLSAEMFSFAGWNTLGSAAVVTRNQGIAIVLNIFFGTVLNAAYGVANQINALVITFASTLTSVFTPMIIKAKGEKDHTRMLFICVFSSKISFYLSSVMALPVLLYTPLLLDLWLDKTPEYTVVFSQIIISSFLILQLYPGLTRGLYAEGNIKWYQITISILLISTIPLGFMLFKIGMPPQSIIIIMAIAQLMTLITTVFFAGRKIKLNTKKFYLRSVIYPLLLFFLIISFGSGLKNWIEIGNIILEFSIVSSIMVVTYSALYYRFILNFKESNLFKSLIKEIINKIVK